MVLKRTVPFFDYKRVFTTYREDLLEIIDDVSSRGAFIMQKELSEFEAKLESYTGAKHVVGVANATDALQMLIMASGLQKGDEVIFCTHTMVATASAIHFAGCKPVPVDVGKDHLIDIDSIEKAITKNTKAIVPTQLNGRTANMDAIKNIAKKHNLLIIEDSAQALGSKYKGQCAGTFDVGGCISFYPAKTLGCFGDGGAILCNDDHIYENLLLLRDHGRGESGDVESWGLNSRLDNIQAAVLSYSFNHYEQDIERRRQIASTYHEGLSHIEELVLPPAPNSDPSHYDIFQNYEIEAQDRDELQSYLNANGIGTLQQWGGKGVHQFSKLGFNVNLPNAEILFKKMLMIPMNPFLSDDDVDYVIYHVQAFYNN